jgi:uncharacterized membrane protein
MSQISLIREEARGKGAKRTIKLPAIPAGSVIQYTKNHTKLKGVISEYGFFNQVTVLNNGGVDVEIALDFTEAKTYPVPATSSIGLDEVVFQEFNVVNLDGANATVVDMITVIPAFERTTLREPMKSKKEIYRRGF